MKVKMLKQTHLGKPLMAGEVVELQDNIANRFVSRGIAEMFVGHSGEPIVFKDNFDAIGSDAAYEDEGLVEPEDSDSDDKLFDKMSAKALFDYIKSQGIKYDGSKLKNKNERDRKAYLLTLVKE